MEKDRIISELRRKLDKAEDDIEYHKHRKEELKEDLKDLEYKIEDLEKQLDFKNHCVEISEGKMRRFMNENK